MSYLTMVRKLTEADVPEPPKVAKKAKEVPLPVCCECRDPIALDEPETWWGLDRVHYACGEAAWQREWRGPPDAQSAH